MIWDTLTLLASGLLLGAWLQARFGKPITQGGWWDVISGVILVALVLKGVLRAIGALPSLVEVLGVVPLLVLLVAAVTATLTNRPVDESTLSGK
jgi:hypothetical protein